MKKKQALKTKLILSKKAIFKLTQEEMDRVKGGDGILVNQGLGKERYSMMDDCGMSTKIA